MKPKFIATLHAVMFAIKNSHLILSEPYFTIGEIDRQPLLGRRRGRRVRWGEGGWSNEARRRGTHLRHYSSTGLLFNWNLVYLSFDTETSLIGTIQSSLIDYRWLSAGCHSLTGKMISLNCYAEISCRHCSFTSWAQFSVYCVVGLYKDLKQTQTQKIFNSNRI